MCHLWWAPARETDEVLFAGLQAEVLPHGTSEGARSHLHVWHLWERVQAWKAANRLRSDERDQRTVRNVSVGSGEAIALSVEQSLDCVAT